MSIHVCKCEHNGQTEWHLRYPGMSEEAAQELADKINSGAFGSQQPAGDVVMDAERWRYALESDDFAVCKWETMFGEKGWFPISETSEIDAALASSARKASPTRDHSDGDYSYLCGSKHCRCAQ